MSQIVLYFLHSTSVFSFYIDVVLTLSTVIRMVENRLKFHSTMFSLFWAILHILLSPGVHYTVHFFVVLLICGALSYVSPIMDII